MMISQLFPIISCFLSNDIFTNWLWKDIGLWFHLACLQHKGWNRLVDSPRAYFRNDLHGGGGGGRHVCCARRAMCHRQRSGVSDGGHRTCVPWAHSAISQLPGKSALYETTCVSRLGFGGFRALAAPPGSERRCL